MLIDAGCLNGGGQIKPISGQSTKGLSQLLESVYMENVSMILDFLNFQVLPLFKSMTCIKVRECLSVCVLMRTSQV